MRTLPGKFKHHAVLPGLAALAAALCTMGCSSTGDASAAEKAREAPAALGSVPQDAFLKAVVDNDAQTVREMAKDNPSVLSKAYLYSATRTFVVPYCDDRPPLEIALSLHRHEVIASLLELGAPCDADGICAGIFDVVNGRPDTTDDERKKTLDILFHYKPELLKDKDFCYDLMDRTINLTSPEILEYLLNKGISAKLEKVDKLNGGPPMTLLDIAYMLGSDECIKILRAHGAKKHPNFDSSVVAPAKERIILADPDLLSGMRAGGPAFHNTYALQRWQKRFHSSSAGQ